ncbi:AMP-binding protein, partial [Pseudomonas corrugata]|uniref:AMP-binding protein n=1 Tax=Pseudomonas corrugata TaxID=47879 RepID=UPI0018EF373A
MPIKNTGGSVNPAPAPLTPGAFLHEIFTARAREFPERTAVSDATRALSYAQLDAASSQLAARLRQEGVKDGMLVGMCLTRSVDLVISLLGILKAGGAYVPLDPAYPAERLASIVEDARPRLLLADPVGRAAVGTLQEGTRYLAIEQALTAQTSTRDPRWDATGLTPAHLAYVI